MTVEQVGKDGSVPGIKPDLGGPPGGRTAPLVKRTRIYVAGPMTGIPQFNIPAFDEAAFALRKQGYDVTSPAELDDPETRAAALASPDGAPGSGSSNGQTWEDFLRRDIDIVRNIEGIAVLPGWDRSKGATFEVDTANKLACWVRPFDPETGDLGEVIPRDALARICARKWLSVFNVDFEQEQKTVQLVQKLAENASGEKRVVDAETGGAKGQKIERFDLLPAEFERAVSLVYGAGGIKYDDDNWRKGYDWRLSLGALRRHLNAWQRGEEHDKECSELAGQPVHHLACAAWHCATLFTFWNEGLGNDNIAERKP